MFPRPSKFTWINIICFLAIFVNYLYLLASYSYGYYTYYVGDLHINLNNMTTIPYFLV